MRSGLFSWSIQLRLHACLLACLLVRSFVRPSVRPSARSLARRGASCEIATDFYSVTPVFIPASASDESLDSIFRNRKSPRSKRSFAVLEVLASISLARNAQAEQFSLDSLISDQIKSMAKIGLVEHSIRRL